ncbi:hypothetical protein [Mycolicibacterium sp. XJ870]
MRLAIEALPQVLQMIANSWRHLDSSQIRSSLVRVALQCNSFADELVRAPFIVETAPVILPAESLVSHLLDGSGQTGGEECGHTIEGRLDRRQGCLAIPKLVGDDLLEDRRGIVEDDPSDRRRVVECVAEDIDPSRNGVRCGSEFYCGG